MDEADRAELHALRARAYGPDADIAADPVASARLHALENPSHGMAVTATSPSEPSSYAAAPRTATAIMTPPVTAPVEIVADTSGPAAAALLRRRRVVALWAGSVALAALAGGLVVAWASAGASAAGVRTVATLAEDTDFRQPSWMTTDPDDTRGFAPFHGIVPVLTTTDWTGTPSDECFGLLGVDDLTGSGGSVPLPPPSCVSGPFAAAVTVTVDTVSPEELRDTYVEGTVLQFVADGDAVRVLMADPAPPTPPEG